MATKTKVKTTEKVVEKATEKPTTKKATKSKKVTEPKKMTEQEAINYLLGETNETNLETIKKVIDENANTSNNNFAVCLANSQHNTEKLEEVLKVVGENAKDIKKNYKMIFVTMVIMMILLGSQFGMLLALTLGAK